MNQVEFGFECGSMRAPRAKASSEIDAAPSEWMTWPLDADRAGRAVRPPVADAEPADLDRHRRLSDAISAGGAGAAPAAARAGSSPRDRANFCCVK